MPVELWPHMRHRMGDYRARARQVGLRRRRRRARAIGARRGRASGARHRRATSTTALPARQGALGLELVGVQEGPRVPLRRGRAGGRRSHPAVRAVYDLPERVLPPAVPRGAGADASRRPPSSWCAAPRSRTASAPSQDLRDYFRMRSRRAAASRRSPTLVEAGELLPVRVEGWKRPAYLHRDAALPRKVDARALLSPFDPVVWERDRTEPLFDFHYRIEIYVPPSKRVHGYYVLPFLLGDRIVGRVDLKADRRAGALLVVRRRAPSRAPRRRPPPSSRPSCATRGLARPRRRSSSSRGATSPLRWQRPSGPERRLAAYDAAG